MNEVRAGVWHWQALHPDWVAAADWDESVSSYAIDDGGLLLLFDPLGVPDEIEALAASRETAIVLTSPWHVRDGRTLVPRLGATLYAPPPDEDDPDPLDAQVFTAGDRLPVGVEAFPGMEPNDLVLWVESHRALVVGDALIDRGDGFEFPRDWADEKGEPTETILERLRSLRELPVELVLPTHGTPTDADALERALS
jgi:glyoxylase-like metal-dependent hydrolase (beta-lactamase superfamily II)